MNLVTVDMMSLIVDGTDLTPGTDLFIGREPAFPDNIVTLFDTPGGGPWLGMRKEDGRYDYSAFQIRIRNRGYDEAMSLGWDLVGILHGIGNQTINNTLYTLVEALDDPALLDWDDNNRARVVVNFAIQRSGELEENDA